MGKEPAAAADMSATSALSKELKSSQQNRGSGTRLSERGGTSSRPQQQSQSQPSNRNSQDQRAQPGQIDTRLLYSLNACAGHKVELRVSHALYLCVPHGHEHARAFAGSAWQQAGEVSRMWPDALAHELVI